MGALHLSSRYGPRGGFSTPQPKFRRVRLIRVDLRYLSLDVEEETVGFVEIDNPQYTWNIRLPRISCGRLRPLCPVTNHRT